MSDRVGRRMASEDSRYRDRARRFIRSVRAAIRRRPSSWRCAPVCIICSTEANASKSACFAVTSGYASKNGTTTSTSSLLRFTEKRRSVWRWLSWRRFSMICPHPNTSWRSSSAGLDGAAWVTENSCWTLPAEEAPGVAHDRDRETAFAVDEADDPLLEPWPFLLIARTGRVVTGHGRTLARGWDSQYRRILGVSSI